MYNSMNNYHYMNLENEYIRRETNWNQNDFGHQLVMLTTN